MLTVKNAYDVVMKNNPEMTAFSCYEYTDCYAFGLVPKDMDKDDMFANSNVYIVNKHTGEYSTVYFMDISNEHIREIDVKSFK